MGGKAELTNNGADLVEIVAFVQAQPLRFRPSWPRALRHNAAQSFFDQLHVMPVGAIDNNGQRNAGRFGQQAALDTLLAPVFDSYERKWLISLASRSKRAPTRGSSAAFDWVV